MSWRIPNPFRRRNELQASLERRLREAEARERKTGEDLVAASLTVQEKHLELDNVERDYHNQLELNCFLFERFERYQKEVELAKRRGRRLTAQEIHDLHSPPYFTAVSGILPGYRFDHDLGDWVNDSYPEESDWRER